MNVTPPPRPVPTKAHRFQPAGLFHREPALRLFPERQQICEPIGGGYFVRIVLRDRLSANRDSIIEIVGEVAGAVAGTVGVPRICSRIDVARFDIAGTPFENSQIPTDAVKTFLNTNFGVSEKHIVIAANRAPFALALVLESEKPTRVVHGVHRTLRDAAKTQFSGKKPALIVAQLYGLTDAELLELAAEGDGGRTALQDMAMDLLARDTWRHVHTLAFTSHGSIRDLIIDADGANVLAQSVGTFKLK